MTKTIAAALLGATALSGASAQAADVLGAMGPILAQAGDAATLDAKCDGYVSEIERRQQALEGETGAATLGGTLTQYDELTALINGGLGDMTQLGYSNISLQFHQNPVPEDLGAATRAWRDEYAVVPAPDWVEFQDAFGHLNGYSAIYYTYRWSKVIADDLFTRFEAEGLRNPQTALAYRRAVLDPGGTKPATQLVHDFLGREVSLDAYRAEMAKDQ